MGSILRLLTAPALHSLIRTALETFVEEQALHKVLEID